MAIRYGYEVAANCGVQFLKSEHTRVKNCFKTFLDHNPLPEMLEEIPTLPDHGPNLRVIAPPTFAAVFHDSPPVVCMFDFDAV